ncbi:MAG TPA: Rieske 2Fe-2S domain-containing protein, partial [Burkholderiales bacterium]|nr:Rieske 2Fe-2S domain-containing protein [Burkholderiales bacterium]
MLSAQDNELLTRSGPGTPGGAYFRRFWLPVALSRQIPEPDCPPIRLKVLGEDLIAFRDTKGRVGVVEPRCPHRGASLYYGRNEECGLRCVYHGWKFDVEGHCMEIPNAPPDSRYKDRIRLLAYPTREYGEIVWAYMGPADAEPAAEIPQLEFGLVPSSHRYVTKRLQQCNWAQSIEGALDTAHASFLHMPAPVQVANLSPGVAVPVDEARARWIRNDPMPQFNIAEHEAGFVIGASRAADGDELYWRTTQFMLPSHATTPSALPGETYFGYTWVPIDDVSCWIYTYAWNPDRPLSESEREKFGSGRLGTIGAVDENYVPLRNRENDYLIDRHDQRTRTYTGVQGVAEQDAMIQD